VILQNLYSDILMSECAKQENISIRVAGVPEEVRRDTNQYKIEEIRLGFICSVSRCLYVH